MSALSVNVGLALLAAAWAVRGQGTLVFDQQSAEFEDYIGVDTVFQEGSIVQSFMPSLSEIDFVRLMVGDLAEGNGLGATLSVLLRESSPTGPIAASTDPVTLLDGFKGVAHLTFGSTIPVVPGVTYYFEPTVTAGSDRWGINSWAYYYEGGMGYWNGVAKPGSDLWFREGIVAVPEPSTVCLGMLGLGVLATGCLRRRQDSKRSVQRAAR